VIVLLVHQVNLFVTKLKQLIELGNEQVYQLTQQLVNQVNLFNIINLSTLVILLIYMMLSIY